MATNKLIDLSRLSRFWDKVKAYVDTNDNAIVDKIYPVGSIYMSVTDSTAAAVEARFGGTWERISEGKALFGYSTTDSAFQTIGSGGGRKEINLQHNHTVDKHTHYMETYTSGNNGNTGKSSGNTGNCTLTISQVPAHSHTVGTRSPGYGQAWKANGASSVASGSTFTAVGRGGDTAWYTETDSKGGGGAHSHSLNDHTHSLNNHTHKIEAYTNPSGPSTDNQLSTAQNILNPYITVYMYKRTA